MGHDPPDDEDEGPPTRRDSGTLSVFEQTAQAALQKLSTLPNLDARGVELVTEARDVLAIFASWKDVPPLSQERSSAIARVLDLHRSVEQYVLDRTPPP